MKNIRLTATGRQREILINWSNVDFVNRTSNQFGDDYTEVHMGDQIVEVQESVEEIENLLGGDGPHRSIELLEEEARQQYAMNVNSEGKGTVTEKLQ